MAKCNMQANDMATTANNWQTPGASNPGRYSGDLFSYTNGAYEFSAEFCVVKFSSFG